MAIINSSVTEAKKVLDNGDLIGLPTETVYGLAGNALDPKAVANIFEVKARPSFDPLIVHSSSLERLSPYIKDLPATAKKLAEAFWPGSMTMVLPRSEKIHDLITSGLDTVAVRVPKHDLTLSLLEQLDYPVAAPSANPFGYISPTSAQHVQDGLGDKIPFILDGGACEVGVESTIIGFPEGVPTIYRKGGIAVEDIEAVIGKVNVNAQSSSQPKAPGMLHRHYAPNSTLLLGNIGGLIEKYKGKDVVTLSLKDTYNTLPLDKQCILSKSGDLSEAARNLFKTLRAIDKLNPEYILGEWMPEEGLGRAMNDRIKRAASLG
ncbi:L-threonylcarbamoyladenylate synthase [Flammeovirga kamogawensis]|uniref:Threonylcarbamoyl-AMP synthase n=1 Tax=Flammeovirga kamogawensis TaxID=373891 RepID=A0ABX8GVY0_9BACT|nr:L-threonylcarbamoyladenylate synthase [Flammeovirga kamogawensis]MBB6464032.1 L-threonylcarbamoyladenylate synthase [Flammeovirga kamogawensis]QWG07362.1 threonylcarbamoyl-AMP synthase [Flammeovirga kamogawensis]TRX69178.1 threonylcarbamoyl-AMP synthase [Flammeovirga kamogawensis]